MKKVFLGADIMLPREDIDDAAWSVVACDQFTSEPEYWEAVEEIVGEKPSTYRMILPEVYLEEPDAEQRIGKINQTMKDYIEEDVFVTYPDSMVYVERIDSTGKLRAGLVGKFDLEAYDYNRGSDSLIRATEATVIERIPPRIKVRKNAEIEMPHIMILIDDKKKTVIEPLGAKKEQLKKLYDFDMMQGGGHISGYLVEADQQAEIFEALGILSSREYFDEQYGLPDKPILLYAMGDGNHSLATAKEFYEQLKAANPDRDMSNHPARYALAELVNLHSDALEFEAIHRILTDVDADALFAAMTEALGLEKIDSAAVTADMQAFRKMLKGEVEDYVITKPTSKLTVGSLQMFLDKYLKENGGKIDYIHGEDVVKNLSMQDNSIGFLLTVMGKEELYPSVIVDGALPRKTFSMGHAEDKRYYMECRKITE